MDIIALQDDVDRLYSWADTNHMRWNHLMFQMIRLGNNTIRGETNVFTPIQTEVIVIKDTVQDLDILVDDGMSYINHIQKAVAKANSKSAWILRTFES